MTNREGFNEHIRARVEKQLAHMESLTDNELMDYTRRVPMYRIEVSIGDELCYYKATHAPLPVGSYDAVAAWLDEEEQGGQENG